MKAVVMAGGEGTRLRPLTLHRPKPLVPVLNKPIAQHIIEHLRRAGISDIVVTLYYLAEEIMNAFGTGAELGVNLIYSIEDSPLGTAGSVKKAEAYLSDGAFIIVSGDALTDIDVEKALAFHREKKSEATIILQHVQNPLEFGVVMTEEDGRISRFLEKPSWGEVFSDTVNTGMYILEPSVFDLMEEGKSYDWSQDIFPQLLAAGRPLYGYTLGEYWTDVGSLDEYRTSQYAFLAKATTLPIDGTENEPGVYVGEGCIIDPQAKIIAPVRIGDNCRIKAGAIIGPDTVLGDNCIVEFDACIEKSILWDSVYVGRKAQLIACTVCHHCTIKDGAEIQEGAVIGDRCQIGDGALIRTMVKLWPDKMIESDALVATSLIWGAKANAALFKGLGVTGIANRELTPDFATKLGASYGAFLKKGATVITARDGHPASRMLKRGILAGLVSVGCNVLDVEAQPLPLARFAVRSNAAQGGVNVRIDPDHPRNALIEFFDRSGIYITKNAERKIETIYFREDYGLADMEEVGEIEFAARTIETYTQEFFAHIREKDIERRKFKVVVDYAYGRISTVLPVILGRLGCDVISLNAYSDTNRAPKNASEREALIYNLSQVVTTLRADLGVIIHSDGERIALVDEGGVSLTGAKLLATLASMVSQTRPGAKIAVPVTAPSVVEQVLRRTNGVVARTKTDPRFLMTHASHPAEKVVMAGDLDGGFLFPELQPAFDGLFAFVKTLEMLSWLQRPLSDFANELPPILLSAQTVRCPFDAKGSVMRRLTEESLADTRNRTDLIDGIKITESEREWALVLPDAADPVFHVYAEGVTQEAAEERAAHYIKKIADMIAV
ncbi:MAG: mannose-1-phosphate guanyltransferase [Akkermansiaceae bacterium]|nr:mannose-1-phosphate guanyltransferase [Armatimonadota bacterium]